MKAVVFHKPKDMRIETVDDPKLEHPEDVILKVTSTAICGSDLHIFNGFIPQAKPMIMGHEFMGVVEEVGPGVKILRRGDRVVVPFPIACGGCFFCNHELPAHCEHSNSNYGPEGGVAQEKGGGLFGYTDLYGGYSGGQAEYVRVPYANFGPRKVSDRFTDEQVLFLTDIFSVSILGVYGMPYDNFPIGQIFDKGITIHSGQALVHRYIDELISWLEEGKITLDDIITHRLPLDDAPRAYDIFNNKEDGCVKVVLNP